MALDAEASTRAYSGNRSAVVAKIGAIQLSVPARGARPASGKKYVPLRWVAARPTVICPPNLPCTRARAKIGRSLEVNVEENTPRLRTVVALAQAEMIGPSYPRPASAPSTLRSGTAEYCSRLANTAPSHRHCLAAPPVF